MLFMPAGSSVLELRHRTDRINNCYYTLAASLDLNYWYQSCEPVTHEDPHTANLIVDTKALRSNLRSMLAGRVLEA
jgi:capsular polysaccharide biosynthesis protein